MPSDGPISFEKASDDGLAWAHYCFGRHCRCPQKGPSHLQELLAMASLGPIIFSEKCRRCPQMGPFHLKMLPTIASLRPIIVLGGAADSLRRAHFALTGASDDGLAWAHYCFGRRCRCLRRAHCVCRSFWRWPRFGPLFFLRSTADALRRARCIHRSF